MVFCLPAFAFSIICGSCSRVGCEINWTGPRGITSFPMERETPSACHSLRFFQMAPVRKAKRETKPTWWWDSASVPLSSRFYPMCSMPKKITRWLALAYTNISLPSVPWYSTLKASLTTAIHYKRIIISHAFLWFPQWTKAEESWSPLQNPRPFIVYHKSPTVGST